MKNIPRKTVQTAWCESCFGLLGEKSAIAPCFCSSSKLAAVAVPGHPPTPTPTRTHTHTRMRAHTHTLTWIHPEGRGWNEMKWYMSCHAITLACHVMLAWVVLAWPPCHVWQWEFAGTFSRRHRWVFVGPCHLCVHGLPAFTLWFRVSHTHSKPLGHDFPYEKECPEHSCFQVN